MTTTPIHEKDSDCTNLDADGNCNDCGVLGGEPCGVCRGVRFHIPICPVGDGFMVPRGGCKGCTFGVLLANGNEVQGCDECAHNDAGFLDAEDIVRDECAGEFVRRALWLLRDVQEIARRSEDDGGGGAIVKYEKIHMLLRAAGFID